MGGGWIQNKLYKIADANNHCREKFRKGNEYEKWSRVVIILNRLIKGGLTENLMLEHTAD